MAVSQGRVLFLTSNYPRWAGDTTTPFVHDLATDLIARGWTVDVLAPHAPGAARDESLDGVGVHRFRYAFPEAAQTVCYGGGALINIAGSRATLVKVPLLVASEWAATALRLRGGYDIVHAHWVLPQGFVATSVPGRQPRIITAHGGDVFGLRGGIVDRFSRRALASADAVTVNSRATEDAVRGLAPPVPRVERIPIGTDTSTVPDPALVADLRAEHRHGDGPFLVFVGRIVADKGIDDVLRTVALLRSTHPQVSAAIVGAGQHLETAQALAAELGISDRVAFPGWADPETVASWFAAGDLVLAPSRIGSDGWQEGQGLSIIEAMAVGRPVIATRTGGIPETITDGVTGVLVDPESPEQLADAVRRLVGDSAELARMGERAADSVRRRFSRDASADAFAGLYSRLRKGR